MAKRKTPKVKDLRPEKITKEQLESLHKLINGLNSAKSDLGTLEIQKSNIMKSVDVLHDMIDKTKKELNEQYGTHDVNIADGTIKYLEDEQVNS
jgi:adenylosuccinate synthase